MRRKAPQVRVFFVPATFALMTMAWAVPQQAMAQSWPAKPIHIVVPFPPGQGADTMMRLLAEKLPAALGQPVIVENKPGAGGAIGMESVAKSPADGYTVVMAGSGPTSISPTLQKLPYDTTRDFDPVTAVASVAQVFMVNAAYPARNLQELIAAARVKPGALNYGSSGQGTTQHLFVEYFASSAGVKLTHVPYKGAGPAMQDLLGGQIPFISDTITAAIPQVKSGKVRAIAVTSGKRSPLMPEVPTLDEQGVKGYEAIGWIGILAPAGSPSAAMDRLSFESQKVIAASDMQKRMADLGLVPMDQTREKFRDFIRSEIQKWAKVIAAAGVKVE